MSAPDLHALDLVPEAVVLIDATGKIRHVNDRARTLLDLADDAVGSDLTDVLEVRTDTGDDITGVLVPKSAVADRIAERIVHVRLRSGESRPVAVTGRLSGDGDVALTFRHAGRRERLDAAASSLVATVSHEIRSPLTSVKGFTRTLLTRWDRFNDDQKRQMLATINEDADRVTRLLTELLDVARIDAGRVRIDRRMASVEPIVSRLVEKLTVGDDPPEITIESANGEIPDLYIDPDKVEQILTNLLENALSHAPGSPISVGVSQNDTEVIVAIRDKGPGVAPEHRREIFSKFFRIRSDRRSGTGLGLYITRGLAEAHGGRVWVESVPGEGATFHVALPKGGIELAQRADDPT
jgi:signal transduction histidine kinase